MALPWKATLQPAAASANNISLSQTPGAAGNLTITGALAAGGVATLDVPRRVLVTTVSNESGKTLTIYGKDRGGNAISEVMAGPNATTGYTTQDFKTVTQVAVSAAFTGAVTVGTNGVASSGWFLVNRNAQPVQLGVAVVVAGTVNYTVEYTYDDIMGAYDPGGGFWINPSVPNVFEDSVLTGQTTSQDGGVTVPVVAARITLNSFTSPGSVVATILQAGIGG